MRAAKLPLFTIHLPLLGEICHLQREPECHSILTYVCCKYIYMLYHKIITKYYIVLLYTKPQQFTICFTLKNVVIYRYCTFQKHAESEIQITTSGCVFASVNHNLNICMSAINGPWKMETYKNNKNRLKPTNHSEERDLFTLYINGLWKAETIKMDQNPPVTVKNVTFRPRWTHFIHFLRLLLRWLTAAKNATVVVIWILDSACYWKAQ